MKTITDLYLINVLSYLHVGSGDNNFGVIDNLVQRDIVTKLPTIHSSSIKGAIKEYFENYNTTQDLIKNVFGSEKNLKGSQTGDYAFLPASLISYPVRTDTIPYANATSPEVIKNYIAKAKEMDIELPDIFSKLAEMNVEENQPIVFDEILNDATIEEADWKAKKAEKPENLNEATKLLGEKLILLNYKNFQQLTDELPALPRNNLDNGKSTNLWYEEVVPSESRFVFFIIKQIYDDKTDFSNDFTKCIQAYRLQIGANFSVGYGQTKISKIYSSQKII